MSCKSSELKSVFHIKMFTFSQGASLSGVRMQRASLEGASLRACNFEDPTGVKSANLEGTVVDEDRKTSLCFSMLPREFSKHIFYYIQALYVLYR